MPENEAESQRLRSLAVTLLSHELRTPLTTISAAVEMLALTLEDPALEADRREFMTIVSQGVKQLSSIIDELLLFSDVERDSAAETPVRRIDLPQVVRDVIAHLSPTIEAKRLQVVQEGLGGVTLETDAGKLAEILLQLVSNAVKFTPAGKGFTIAATQVDDDVHLTVVDQGPGLTEADCAELFTAFHQGENPMRRHQGGLGLGLYLAQRLARSLGGEIRATGAPGTGAVFTLVLPRRSQLEEENHALSQRLAELEAEIRLAHENLQQLSDYRHLQDEALTTMTDQLWEQSRRLQSFQGQIATRTAQLERSFSDAVKALSASLEMRCAYLYAHARRTAAYAMTIAREMGLPEAELPQLGIAALLHDVGAIALRDALIEPQALPSDVSGLHLQVHCATGAELVGQVASLQGLTAIIRAHHERWDGTGFPDRLAGEAIPLAARVLAVADTFDNAMCDFVYRRGLTLDAAVAAIRAERGLGFDPQVVDAFGRLADGGAWKATASQYPAPGVLDDCWLGNVKRPG